MSGNQHLSRNNRLRGYDYTSAGVYFVTICTHNRAPRLGTLRSADVQLTAEGQIAHRTWLDLPLRFPSVELDEFIVMPDHFHGIVVLHKSGGASAAATDASLGFRPTLSRVIRAFKSLSAIQINRRLGAGGIFWQKSYYDHIIRSGESLDKIRRYILENPLRWSFERDNPNSP